MIIMGWRCPRTKLWRILLRVQVIYLKRDTLLLNEPIGRESINFLYTVLTSAAVLDHIESSNTNYATVGKIRNVYELPSLARAVKYLHAAAGFPTKSIWLKSIFNGNYLTCPLIIVKNVDRHFPESEETKMGNLYNQRQGLRSTKAPHPVTKPTSAEKKRNVFINVYNPKGKCKKSKQRSFPTSRAVEKSTK